MLRVLLLVVAASAVNSLECQHHWYELYSADDNKQSACDVIYELVGSGYTLRNCFDFACRLNADVINFKQTTDKYDDNVCQMLSCPDGDLKLVDAKGFSVYPNNMKKGLRCHHDNGRFLSCWTCENQPDEELCKKYGTLRACESPKAMCWSSVDRDPKGVVSQVSRGCKDADLCTAPMWGHLGACAVQKFFELSDLQSSCQKCGFGGEAHHSRCFDIVPNLHLAQSNECKNGWIHVIHANDGKSVACKTLHESNLFDEDACLALACFLGGNVVSHRFKQSCKIHMCGLARTADEDFELLDTDHGWNIYASSAQYGCNKVLGSTLTCWTCKARTEEDCLADGRMEDCPKDEDVCGHERHYSKYGKVIQVTRGCQKRDQCSAESWSDDITTNCVTLGSGRVCNRCLYGKPGAEHGCHQEFQKGCVQKFKEVPTVELGDGLPTKCRQVFNARYHWLESCFNLACELSANMVMFGGSQCEVYSCEEVKKPIFYKRKEHNMAHHYRF